VFLAVGHSEYLLDLGYFEGKTIKLIMNLLLLVSDQLLALKSLFDVLFEGAVAWRVCRRVVVHYCRVPQ